MIYPDEEKLTYSYNTGGQLTKVRGEKAYGYDYVQKLGYDKFEQRVYMKYGNGTETKWEYDEKNRRLNNLDVWDGTSNRRQIMKNAYKYDLVGNVTSVANTAPLPTSPPSGDLGGQMTHTYTYDNLYRLVSASGAYSSNSPFGGQGAASYTLEMTYDNLYNITSKKQTVSQSGIQFDGTLKAGYQLDYKYNLDKPHQIATLGDQDYRVEGQTVNESDKVQRERQYEYDAKQQLLKL